MRFVIVIREPGSAAQWWPADVSSVQRATNHRCNFISAQAESERLIRLDRAAGQPSVCRVRLSASGVGRQGMARLRIHVGGLAGWLGAWWVESCLAASGSIRRSGSGAPPATVVVVICNHRHCARRLPPRRRRRRRRDARRATR